MEVSIENQADLANAAQADKITITVIILITTSLVCKAIITFNDIFVYSPSDLDILSSVRHRKYIFDKALYILVL